GDSFTFVHGVQVEKSYPKVLEALLRDSGYRASVFNAGVPGYSFDQTFRAFPARLQQVDLHVVLAGVNCSDLGDGCFWPLYDIRPSDLAPLPAWKTGAYLQGVLMSVTPAWLLHSALFDQIIRRLPARDFFWQRPWASRDDLHAWVRDKIDLEIGQIALH